MLAFKTKRTITSMAAGMALAVAYIVYALGKNAPSAEDTAAWALAILVLLGIAVIASIVIQILFHIVYSVGVAIKEQTRDDKEVERIVASESMEDELDKQIALKASRAGYVCAGIGFVVMLIWLAFFGVSAVVALHIMLGALFIGAFIENCLSIRCYEKGIR